MTYRLDMNFGLKIMRPEGVLSGIQGNKPSLVIMDDIMLGPGTIKAIRVPRGRRGKKKMRWVLTLRDGSTRRYYSEKEAQSAKVLRGL